MTDPFWLGLHKPDQLWQWRSDNSNVTEFTDWTSGYGDVSTQRLRSHMNIAYSLVDVHIIRAGNDSDRDYAFMDCDSNHVCQWNDDVGSNEKTAVCSFSQGRISFT